MSPGSGNQKPLPSNSTTAIKDIGGYVDKSSDSGRSQKIPCGHPPAHTPQTRIESGKNLFIYERTYTSRYFDIPTRHSPGEVRVVRFQDELRNEKLLSEHLIPIKEQ